MSFLKQILSRQPKDVQHICTTSEPATDQVLCDWRSDREERAWSVAEGGVVQGEFVLSKRSAQ